MRDRNFFPEKATYIILIFTTDVRYTLQRSCSSREIPRVCCEIKNFAKKVVYINLVSTAEIRYTLQRTTYWSSSSWMIPRNCCGIYSFNAASYSLSSSQRTTKVFVG